MAAPQTGLRVIAFCKTDRTVGGEQRSCGNALKRRHPPFVSGEVEARYAMGQRHRTGLSSHLHRTRKRVHLVDDAVRGHWPHLGQWPFVPIRDDFDEPASTKNTA
jgi:hypothetical protein